MGQIDHNATQGQAPAPTQWFRGLPHLTRDSEGYIYWRGVSVEHYSFDASQADAELQAAQELVARCLKLEANGIPVSGRTVLCADCFDAPADTPWKLALQTYYSFFEKDDQFIGVFYSRNPSAKGARAFSIEGEGNAKARVVPFEDSYVAFHALQAQGFQSVGPSQSFETTVSWLERLGLSPEQLEAAIFGVAWH